jgi:hypothetical protein
MLREVRWCRDGSLLRLGILVHPAEARADASESVVIV